MTSRRALAIRGGGVASAGQALAVLMSLVTAVLLSRLLGPSDFAIYAVCLSLSVALSPISQMGINAWLMSREHTPRDNEFNIALGGMLAISLLVAVVTSCALPFLEEFSNVTGLLWAGIFTVALTPLEVLALPASTRLERNLSYRTVTRVSLASQFFGQFIGIILALMDFGVWGPLIGWLVRSLYFCVGCWLAIQQFPSVQWNFSALNVMLGFGLGHTISSALSSGRSLLFLGLIGRWFGGDVVGIVAFSLRVAEFCTPFRVVAGRMIVPVLAPIADKAQLMNIGQRKASELEILITVPLAVCGGALYFLVAIPLLGDAWKDTLIVLPWVLVGKMLVVPHAAAFSALNMKGHFGPTVLITMFGLVLETTVLWFLGRTYGLEGIGAATIVFWIPALMIHWVAIKQLSFAWNFYAQLWAWAGVSACLSMRFGLFFAVGFVSILLMTWREIRDVVREVIGTLFK
jgi:O-antigen/teichoic acid export membrane protein